MNFENLHVQILCLKLRRCKKISLDEGKWKCTAMVYDSASTSVSGVATDDDDIDVAEQYSHS